MPVGLCKLCLKTKELRKSHFIGAGAYRMANRRGGAVVMTPLLFVGTDSQIQEYVLCGDCEQLFSQRGEDYVTPLLCQDDKRFPLLEILGKDTPVFRGKNHGDRFSGARVGLDVEKIAYYGLSMFWRAAVHAWNTKIKGQVTQLCKLSPDDLESIRKYLLGEAAWPSGIVLQVTVCIDRTSQNRVQPPVDWENDVYKGSRMVAFGLEFMLIAGVKPGAPEWKLCCMAEPERWIFRHSCEETTRDRQKDLQKNAKIADNLKRTQKGRA